MNDLSTFSNAFFDMNHCASVLTWRKYHKDKPLPVFMKYVEERDLFIKDKDTPWYGFKSEETAVYYEAMRVLGRTFEMYDTLQNLNEVELKEYLYPIGLPELNKKIEKIEEIAKRVEFKEFCGYKPVAVLYCNEGEDRLVSDIGAYLYKTYPEILFAAMLTTDGQWSLRSDKFGNNFDVSKLARQYGGGGHHSASGFSNNGKVVVR